MISIDALLTEIRTLDASASRSTWLSRLDPRALVLATLAYLVAVVSFDRYAVAALLPLAILPLALARLGDLDLARIGAKAMLAMPFALLVGLFNPVFDTLPRMSMLGFELSGGWLSLTSILIRGFLTVAAAVILVAGVGMPRLAAALERLGAPRILTTQLSFLHRYLVLLAAELGRMNLARELRSSTPSSTPLAVYGSLLGHLLLRTFERAHRIHRAMLSRGFDGRMPTGAALRWSHRDTVFLAVWLGVLGGMRAIDLPALLGHWLLKAAA